MPGRPVCCGTTSPGAPHAPPPPEPAASGGGAESSAEACLNATDDDGDGFIDCADQDCWRFAACTADTQGGDTSADAAAGPEGDTVVVGPDAGAPDGSPEPVACDPCGPRGSVKGRVCAPSSDVYIHDATVWIEGVGCDGEPFRVETVSALDGSWYLVDVPCGAHTLRIEKGAWRAHFTVTVEGGRLLDVGASNQKACFGANAARVAVLDGTYDDLAGLLDTLGVRYDRFNADGDAGAEGAIVDLLGDPQRLAGYDILFAECGGTLGWLPQDAPAVMPNVKDYVLGGGSLYMSDYAWVLGEWSFPDKVEWYGDDDPAGMGRDGSPQVIPSGVNLTATITDGNLAGYLGKTSLPIRFDDGSQIAPERVQNGAFAHVIATIAAPGGLNIPSAPLALSYRPAESAGRVIYTNFHNDAQATSDMLTILRYLVFLL